MDPQGRNNIISDYVQLLYLVSFTVLFAFPVSDAHTLPLFSCIFCVLYLRVPYLFLRKHVFLEQNINYERFVAHQGTSIKSFR